MKLSTRSRYGTRAMIEIARRNGTGPTKRRDIAEAQGISEAYLENILTNLRAGGFLVTQRGSEGGFVLLRKPSQITLYDIVESLEGSLAPVECVERPETCSRSVGVSCAARDAWKKLYDAQVGVLKSMTLQDLADSANGVKPPMFEI